MLKKIVDVLKELVKECNFEVNSEGIKVQAMDSSHVCLVTFHLRADGFEEGNYRCDKPGHLGINVDNLQKILKCAGEFFVSGQKVHAVMALMVCTTLMLA